MSTLTKYYKTNKAENPYTMEGFSNISRVKILMNWIKELPKGSKILDVGCGDMYLAKQLTEYSWIGIDVDNIAHDSRMVSHDLESFPWPCQPVYDVVICSEVLEHLFDPVKVTKEIHRLLKPGGIYILSTPNADFIDHFIDHFEQVIFDIRKSWTKEHIHLYNRQSHEMILATCGFEIVKYSGADTSAGKFFPQAEKILMEYKQPGFDPEVVMGEMFKDWAHTIIIKAKKK